MRTQLHRLRADEGFTLIELLVVTIIIGILASIAMPVLLKHRQTSYDAAVKSDLHNAATAEEAYLADNGAYSAQSPVAGELATQNFRPSEGSDYQGGTATITTKLSLNGGSYCLSARSASGADWVWDSSHGGLQAPNTACSF
ncbi:MAG TPA: prepilin-type N-terminal cleavage/methylation domain-containing protein [Mycobacteriales bacterium]|nr:prepilin-type N-terminal cleavage/methylation domain-containing protein [Mycobacteriales bacterium]